MPLVFLSSYPRPLTFPAFGVYAIPNRDCHRRHVPIQTIPPFFYFFLFGTSYTIPPPCMVTLMLLIYPNSFFYLFDYPSADPNLASLSFDSSHCPPHSIHGQSLLHLSSQRFRVHLRLPTQIHPILRETW